MGEERFIELETRLAHQDQMLHELNDVVTSQQARLMQVEELCRSLTDRIRALGESMATAGQGDERPPHY